MTDKGRIKCGAVSIDVSTASAPSKKDQDGRAINHARAAPTLIIIRYIIFISNGNNISIHSIDRSIDTKYTRVAIFVSS